MHKNIILYFLEVIFRPHEKIIKIRGSRAPQNYIITQIFDIMRQKKQKKRKNFLKVSRYRPDGALHCKNVEKYVFGV